MIPREETIEKIRRTQEVSVLIVGGGINGAGLFRELALQGIDVLLVDKSDFCAGASSAPSRMIHGGLRYLENGEFRLVRESLKERNLLLENAPHYVKPLPTTVPIFSWLSGLMPAVAKFLHLSTKPTNRGAVMIKVGLWLYDFLTRHHRVLPRHFFTSRDKSLALRPLLNADAVCTATYYDAWISYPERLCLELIQDAEAANPHAHALNYVALEKGDQNTVMLRDELTSDLLTIQPRLLVNATGAWIDLTNQSLQHETAFIGGTKGSHLIIDNPQLFDAMQGEMLYYENFDNRVCIMFPLLGKVLAGSTDIRINHPSEGVTTEEDIQYILESIRQVFPSIQVKPSEIIFHFCGIRPLPNQQKDMTGQISRDHSCLVIEPNERIHFPVYSLIGGKWTTFRAFAEQVADQVLTYLNQPRRVMTHHLPIGGGKNFPQAREQALEWHSALEGKTGISSARLHVLLDRYGTQAEQVAVFVSNGPDKPLEHNPGYSRREIEFLVRQERIVHLDDLLLRRTTLALQGELTAALLKELASITAAIRGWSKAEMQREIERARKVLRENHSVHLSDDERESAFIHV